MTRRESEPWGKPSTTSTLTNSGRAGGAGELGRLIADLPPERAEPVFTHSSWAPDRASSYERLEFLGDSVLELAVARALFERYPDFPEGRLAKLRSHVVSRASCAVVAKRLDLGSRLAPLSLEYGFEAIEPAVVDAFTGRIEYALNTHVDHKTELPEALARAGRQV